MTVLFELARNFHPILSLSGEAGEPQPGGWLIDYLFLMVTAFIYNIRFELASPVELTASRIEAAVTYWSCVSALEIPVHSALIADLPASLVGPHFSCTVCKSV